jgi:phosphoribosylformylglycinamidine synthase
MDIAGICDPSGRIFGLMPHPEAYHHWTNHPDWMRIKEMAKRRDIDPHAGPTVGIQLLKNAVDFVKQN